MLLNKRNKYTHLQSGELSDGKLLVEPRSSYDYPLFLIKGLNSKFKQKMPKIRQIKNGA